MLKGTPQSVLLIVDDEADIRDVLKDALDDIAPRILTAENGRAALDMVMKGLRPDAILSDINMPEMNGMELLISLNDLGLNVPFVFLTGYGNEEAVKLAEELGGFAFLEKPFELDTLKNTVKKSLETGVRIKELELYLLSGKNISQNQRISAEKELESLIKLRAIPQKKVS